MQRGIYLGEIFGIPVRLHYTWFPAAILIIAALAQQFQSFYPLWLNVILGIVASLLFLASVSARELVHSFVAINRGMPVRSVTLYVLGGAPRIDEDDTRPVPEILVAISGPVTSLVIAGVFYGISYTLATSQTTIQVLMPFEFMQWLFFFNMMIALINLIPAFPLDMGRVLRAILQSVMRNHSRATRITTVTARVIGFILVAAGILAVVLQHDWFVGIATAALGWFVEDAATSSQRQALVRDVLHGIKAHDMMSQDYTPIKQQLTFALIREYIINSGQHCFLVIEDGKLQGIVTLGDIQIPPRRWATTRISDIMTPARRLKTGYPDQPVVELLEQMEDYSIDQVPVIQRDKVVGLVTRERLLRFLKARAMLRA